MIFTNANVSPSGTVNPADIRAVLKNMGIFLAPLLLVYFLQIYVVLQTNALTFNDLIPNKYTQGSLELYVVNAIMDFLRKLTNPN